MEPLTRARRREMTREHLMDAAATVFARDGFHAASLDDVAALAGFTKGAVYSNFKSKDDLFLAVFDHRLNREAGIQQHVRFVDIVFGQKILPITKKGIELIDLGRGRLFADQLVFKIVRAI